jgi:hypothetical protein
MSKRLRQVRKEVTHGHGEDLRGTEPGSGRLEEQRVVGCRACLNELLLDSDPVRVHRRRVEATEDPVDVNLQSPAKFPRESRKRRRERLDVVQRVRLVVRDASLASSDRPAGELRAFLDDFHVVDEEQLGASLVDPDEVTKDDPLQADKHLLLLEAGAHMSGLGNG